MSGATAPALSSRELQLLQEIGEFAASTRLPFELLRVHALRLLRRLLRTERAVFFLAGTRTRFADPVAVNVESVWLDRYLTHFIHQDPFLQDPFFKTISRRCAAFRRKDLPDEARFFRSPFYNEYWRPQSISDVLGISLAAGDHFFGGIGFHRFRSDPPFGDREVRLARAVAPILTLALERHGLLAQLGGGKHDEVGERLGLLYALSPREEEVARTVIKGLTNLEISQVLGISEFTVKRHLQNIFAKVHVRSRSALTARLLTQLPQFGIQDRAVPGPRGS